MGGRQEPAADGTSHARSSCLRQSARRCRHGLGRPGAADLRRPHALQPRCLGGRAAQAGGRDPEEGRRQARHGVELEQRGHQDAAGRSALGDRARAQALSLARRAVDLGQGPDDHSASSRRCSASASTWRSASSTSTAPTPTCPTCARWSSSPRSTGSTCIRIPTPTPSMRHFQQDPSARVLWAHSGFERPEKVREMLRRYPEPVVRSRLPHRARLERQGGAGLARGFPGIPRPLRGRHRHLHARALALRRRACALVAPVAGRPAAATWRARSPTRTASACSVASSAAAMRLLAALHRAADRRSGLGGLPARPRARHRPGRSSPSHYMVAFRPDPVRIEVGEPFSLLFNVCTKSDKPAELVAIDAQMPEHKHGMNYRPTIVSLGDGRYRVEGMVFHMPGRWELAFDVRAGEESERLTPRVHPEVKRWLLGAVLAALAAQGRLQRPLSRRRRCHGRTDEVKAIARHGPWPPPAPRDPSNRVAGTPNAIVLGEHLFNEPRLSADGAMSCATCHVAGRDWSDGRRQGDGAGSSSTAARRRCGTWATRTGSAGTARRDSLWSQSIRPILDPREMAGDAARRRRPVARGQGARLRLRARVRPQARRRRREASGRCRPRRWRRSRRRWSARARRSTLSATGCCRATATAAARYPAAAQRGLKIFIAGELRGLPFRAALHQRRVRRCRHPVLHAAGRGRFRPPRRPRQARQTAPSTCWAGTTTTPRAPAPCARGTSQRLHSNFGEFRVPSLRQAGLGPVHAQRPSRDARGCREALFRSEPRPPAQRRHPAGPPAGAYGGAERRPGRLPAHALGVGTAASSPPPLCP